MQRHKAYTSPKKSLVLPVSLIRISSEEVLESTSDFNSNEIIAVGTIYRDEKRRRGDSRDTLPFVIVSYDKKVPMEIGTFMLEPSTSNGDYVDLGMKGMYKVIRVRFLYKFTDGKHRVYKKKLDVIKSRPAWINDANSGGESEANNFIMGEFLQ